METDRPTDRPTDRRTDRRDKAYPGKPPPHSLWWGYNDRILVIFVVFWYILTYLFKYDTVLIQQPNNVNNTVNKTKMLNFILQTTTVFSGFNGSGSVTALAKSIKFSLTYMVCKLDDAILNDFTDGSNVSKQELCFH